MATWIDEANDARTNGTPPIGAAWYAQPNDVIGGWCVTTTDEPPGKSGIQEVADFVDEATARHVADIHNLWLLGTMPSLASPRSRR